MNISTEVINVLKDNKIFKIKDIDDFPMYKYSTNNEMICGVEGTWIEDVFQIIKEDLELCSNQLAKDVRKYVTFNNDSDDILKYACMFPTSSINLKGKFDIINRDRGPIYYIIPKQFLRSLLRHKDLLKANVYKILPEIITSEGDSECSTCGQYDTWTLAGKTEYWNNRPVNESVDVISSSGVFLSDEKVEKLYFTFPWLYGASISDYVDIVNKNKLMYENYCITTLRFIENIRNGDYTSMKQEMDEANINIKIALEKAKHSLLRKGIQTVVNVAFTFIPLTISLPEEQKAILSTIFGTTSLERIISIFSNEISEIRNVGKDSPFWIMYQWSKKVKFR